MAKPTVYFIELAVAQKPKYICEITEKLFNLGKQIHIFANEKKDGRFLDQLLWTWKQDSFIPHGLAEENEEPEAVQICTGALPATGAEALILNDPLLPDAYAPYSFIIDFAETYDKQKLNASRARFKQIRDSNQFTVDFLKLGAFLGQKM
jgi:DNA polymerase-3 subunit chi